MKHLTMVELENLGFDIVQSYVHDDFMTQKRQKGKLTVETTWKKSGEFVSQNVVYIRNYPGLTPDKIIQLDKIVNL